MVLDHRYWQQCYELPLRELNPVNCLLWMVFGSTRTPDGNFDRIGQNIKNKPSQSSHMG